MTRRELLLSVSAAALPALAAAPAPLGTLDRFWRYSPVLGPFHETGHGLMEIPSEMLEGDFAYPKRPFAQEAPFADHLSMVRLLGGFNEETLDGARERDLAYRDSAGKIAYRMNLLAPRLKPYLDQGYDSFTFVLDNVPYCFPAKPHAVGLGQHVPPRDTVEWRAFVEVVCRELVRILGPERMARQRFRVGTENNGRVRFDGTQEEFARHYDSSVAAVRAVVPGARIGPFNISGINGLLSSAASEHHNVNAFALAEHCYRDAKRPTPIDFVSYSRYFRPGDSPLEHADICRRVWEEFGRRVPALAKVSREIHEFGVAPWGEVDKGVFARAECGAMGAALTMQMMLRLRMAGINRLWHWNPFDTAIRVRGGARVALPTGTVWLLSVLEHMAGGEAWTLAPSTDAASQADYLAVLSERPGRTLVLVSAYNRDIARNEGEWVRLRIPRANGKARIARLTRETSIHDRIRQDLAAAGQLNQTFAKNPGFNGTVRQMAAGLEGEMLIGARRAEYMKQWRRSLTLEPLDPANATLQTGDSGMTLSLRMTAPELAVVSIA